MSWSRLASRAVVCSLLLGCGGPLIYPMKPSDSQPIVDAREFGDVEVMPDSYKERAIMMAGRIVSGELDTGGVKILAEWLPVPRDMKAGPLDSAARPDQLFILRYPKEIDSSALWKGNKFVAVGQIKGTVPVADSTVPNFQASCVHVWKTRELSIADAVGAFYNEFPVLEQVYCLKQ
jgi:hypothetical protein